MKKKAKRKNKTLFTKKEISKLPERPGKYELIQGNRAVYVGETKNVNRRLSEHKNEGKKKASHFKVSYMPKRDARRAEKKTLRSRKTKYNKKK